MKKSKIKTIIDGMNENDVITFYGVHEDTVMKENDNIYLKSKGQGWADRTWEKMTISSAVKAVWASSPRLAL